MRRREITAIAAGVLMAAFGTMAIAQYALDGGLSARTGRINPGRAKTQMSKPVYTVNRATGTFTYNRANAFNDPGYSIYQRYTGNRTENFTPAGVSTAGRVQARPPQAPRVPSGTPAPPRPTTPAVRSPTYRPATRVHTSVPPSPISTPRYSVRRTGR